MDKKMSLEQVRDWHRDRGDRAAAYFGSGDHEDAMRHRAMADAIDAELKARGKAVAIVGPDDVIWLKPEACELDVLLYTAPTAQADKTLIVNMDQAAAWRAVADALTEVAPGWQRGDGTGMECAVAAIKRLAQPAQAAQPVGVDGWVMVPREATDDMLVAGQEAWWCKRRLRDSAIEDCHEARDVWNAMLKVAASFPNARGWKLVPCLPTPKQLGAMRKCSINRHSDMYQASISAAPQPPAQPSADAFDFERHLLRQREWSGRTFGPGARSQGCVDHIRKELREIEANPGDLEEWIDVAILALDGAWRSGAQPADIVAALVAKQTKNERRKWPDWRTADPNHAIEHDRSEDDPMSADSSDRRWEDFER